MDKYSVKLMGRALRDLDGIYNYIAHTLLEEKLLPQMPEEVEKVSYLDGCKVYFKDGGWIIARFSGTEPLLRIFCEMSDKYRAARMCECFEEFLGISYQGN